MSSGLSMTSVNKIKELAAAKDYSVAEDILDSQNLSKSLNPQFIRICGEVYENVGRYKDARKQYVRAHIMAPESNRIIFSIISLYLKMGYFGLAEKYYQQYIFNAKDSTQDINNINYIMNKTKDCSYEEQFGLLYPYYADNIDETWSLELVFISKLYGREDVFENVSNDYCATFRYSKSSQVIEDVKQGKKDPLELYDIYAKSSVEEEESENDEILQQEKKQLEEDYYRMYPKEPEILIMVDDNEEIPKGVLKKFNKMKKKEAVNEGISVEASEEKTEDETLSQENTEEDKVDKEEKPAEKVKQNLKAFIIKKFKKDNKNQVDEETVMEESKEFENSEKPEVKEEPEDSEKPEVKEEEENSEEPEVKEEEENSEEPEVKEEEENSEEPEAKEEEENSEEPEVKEEEENSEKPEVKEEVENSEKPEVKEELKDMISIDEGAGAFTEEEMETFQVDEHEDESEEIVASEDDSEEDFDIELSNADDYEDKSESLNIETPEVNVSDIFAYDFDDGFAPESNTISELDGEYAENYVDSFNENNSGIESTEMNNLVDENEVEPEVEADGFEEADFEEAEKEAEPEVEADFEEAEPEVEADFEEAEKEAEPEVETEGFDETDFEEADFDEADFDETEKEAEPEVETDGFEEADFDETDFDETDFDEADFDETEKEAEPEVETDGFEESDFEEADFDEADFDETDFDETEKEAEPEVETDGFEETDFDEADFEEAEKEAEPEVETDGFEESDFDEADFDEADFETESDVESEEVDKADVETDKFGDEAEDTVDVPSEDKTENFVESSENKDIENIEGIEENTSYNNIGYDYPVFKSSLFPNLNNKDKEIKNDFDDVAKAEKEKLDERLLEEERMQREAEELLASLGIKL